MEKLVKEFVEKKVSENDNILAAIFYGSSCYHSNNDHSDVDLLFITKDGPSMRGKINFKGKKVEYFLRSVSDLEQKCMTLIADQETYLLSVFSNGKVIYNQNRTFERFQKYFRFRYQSSLPVYNIDKREKDNMIQNWQILNQSINNEIFWTMYFNLLNQIRINYQKMKGYSKIPISKLSQFYQNREYAQKYYCSILPPQEFTDDYLKCITETDPNNARNQIKQYETLFTIQFPEGKENSINVPTRKDNFYPTPKMANLMEQAAKLITQYEQTSIAIQSNRMDKNYLYFIVLEQLRRFYEIQCGILNTSIKVAIQNYQAIMKNTFFSKIDPEFAFTYQKAIMAKSDEEKLKYLDQIYQFALRDIPINKDEYLIKLQRNQRS